MSRRNIFFIIALVYVSYIIFPLFETIIPVQIISLITFASILILYPRAFLNKLTLWVSVYLILLLLYALVDKPVTVGIGTMSNIRSVILESSFMLPSLAILNVFSYIKDSKMIKNFGIASSVILLVSVLYVILALKANPYVLREAHSEQQYIPGLPQYTLMHAYIILLPLFFYALRQRKGRAVVYLALMCYLYLIYSTYITTLLFLTILVAFFCVIYQYRKNIIFWGLLIPIIFIGLYLLAEKDILVNFLERIADFYADTAVEPKIQDLKNSYIQGHVSGDTIEGRMDYHQISWNSFYSNMLIGGGEIGRHSSLIDRLGGMGLLVFIPYIMILITSIRKIKCVYIGITQNFYFYISVACILVLLYNKGLFGVQGWVFYWVLLPTMCYYLQYKDTKSS